MDIDIVKGTFVGESHYTVAKSNSWTEISNSADQLAVYPSLLGGRDKVLGLRQLTPP